MGIADTPTVSIVIPAYNHADYLRESIDSVLAQTYPSIELIVLNDGSSDATEEILKNYGTRFKWETHANMGQSATLNKGWRMAQGSILGYLSADDTLKPDSVATAVAALDNSPEVVATYSDFTLIDAQSSPFRSIETPDFDVRDLVLKLECQPGPGAYFRADAWAKAGPWDGTLQRNPDLDFWIRLAMFGPFRRIPKELAGFRVHGGSNTAGMANISQSDEPIIIVHKLLAMETTIPWVQENKGVVIASAYIASAQLHLRSGRYATTLQRLIFACSVSLRTVFALKSIRRLLSSSKYRVKRRIQILIKQPCK